MGRDKGRGKPLPWEVGWIHVTLSLFSETLTTAAQRAGGIADKYVRLQGQSIGLDKGHAATGADFGSSGDIAR